MKKKSSFNVYTGPTKPSPVPLNTFQKEGDKGSLSKKVMRNMKDRINRKKGSNKEVD